MSSLSRGPMDEDATPRVPLVPLVARERCALADLSEARKLVERIEELICAGCDTESDSPAVSLQIARAMTRGLKDQLDDVLGELPETGASARRCPGTMERCRW